MNAPTEMTASDLRALAQLIDDRKVVVVRHENLLAVLRPAVTHRAYVGRDTQRDAQVTRGLRVIKGGA